MGLFGDIKPAMAREVDYLQGQRIFESKCALCHAGGSNLILKDRNLANENLLKYLDGGKNIDAVV